MEQSNVGIFIIVLLSNLIFWGGMIWLISAARKRGKRLKAQGGKLGWLTPRVQIDGNRFRHADEDFAFTLSSGDSPAFHVRLQAGATYPKRFEPRGGVGERFDFMPRITLRGEGRMAQRGKALGIIGEFQTGDPRFDDAVFIDTQAPEEFLREVLGSQGLRDAVRTLLADGWHGIVLYDNTAPVALLHSTPDPTRRDVDYFWGQLERMIAIRDALPAVRVAKARQKVSLGAKFGIWSGVFVLAVGIMTAANDRSWLVFDSALLHQARGVGLAIWLAWMGPIFLILRGRSNSLRSLLVAGSCLLAALLIGASPTARWLNAKLDTSEPVALTALVVDHRVVKGDDSTSYYITLGATEHTPEREFRVRSSVHSQAKRNGELDVRIRAGGLDTWWVESFGVD